MIRKLVILDFKKKYVHMYNVDSKASIDSVYIKSLGFDIGQCAWMLADNIEVAEHKGILY